MVADFWMTCWVDAGQPELDDLIGISIIGEKRVNPFIDQSKFRNHESGERIKDQ